MHLPFLSLATVAAVTLVGTTDAGLVNFVFPIDSTQEVVGPRLPDAGVPEPLGTGNVTYNTETNELYWTINYENLTGGVVSPGANFHGPAAPGQVGDIKILIDDGTPATSNTGIFTGSALVTDADELDLMNGLWYVNLHTAMNMSGEIRGQVVATPTPGTAVIGLVGLIGLLRIRR